MLTNAALWWVLGSVSIAFALAIGFPAGSISLGWGIFCLGVSVPFMIMWAQDEAKK